MNMSIQSVFRLLAILLWATLDLAFLSPAALAQNAVDTQNAPWMVYKKKGLEAYRRGNLVEAEQFLRNSCEEAHKYGDQDPRFAKSLNNLAAIYTALARYSEAEPLLQQALSIEEKSTVPQSLDEVATLHNLAVLYVALGKDAAAEPLLKHSIEIKERGGGTNAALLDDLESYAQLLRRLKREPEAQAMAQRANTIRAKVTATVGQDRSLAGPVQESQRDQSPTTALQPSVADMARQIRVRKEQKSRQERSIDVYEGRLTFRASPKFADVPKQLVSEVEIFVRNSSPRDYRYIFTAKCGEWRRTVSSNIKGSSPGASVQSSILIDVSPPCDWGTTSLEDFKEAEGLAGGEPQPSKVPGVDDAELARRAKIQEVIEDSPRISISELQRRVDEACKPQPLAGLATAPVSDIGDHMTGCVKANDDLAAALRVQGGTQAKARTETMNKPAARGVVVVRLTGTTGLPFTGTCSFSNRGGTNSKSYDDVLPFQVTGESVDTVNCSFISKSDFRHDMKLEILKDGQVIGESDTNAPYGLVSVVRDIN
jgi:tetratricopeptide (TPR) repeat protein